MRRHQLIIPLGQTRLVPAGRVGSTVEIKGVAGAKAAVTLLKVVDPARATGQLITKLVVNGTLLARSDQDGGR